MIYLLPRVAPNGRTSKVKKVLFFPSSSYSPPQSVHCINEREREKTTQVVRVYIYHGCVLCMCVYIETWMPSDRERRGYLGDRGQKN